MYQVKSKRKYTQPKTAGRYRSTNNQSGKSRRRKANDAERRRMRETQPLVTLVVLPSGKRRFVREYPDQKVAR